MINIGELRLSKQSVDLQVHFINGHVVRFPFPDQASLDQLYEDVMQTWSRTRPSDHEYFWFRYGSGQIGMINLTAVFFIDTV